MTAATIGIDEVGRGCLAGPLVAAAVYLCAPIAGLRDSKQLSKTQRENLASKIYLTAKVGIGWVAAHEIDEWGLTLATSKAMSDALAQIGMDAPKIIIDGNFNYLPQLPFVMTIEKADSLVPTVSAASIIAKVARDDYMRQAASRYPQYQFEKHVGYGTRLHLEMLSLHGICELHRKSYKPVRAFV